MIQRLLASLASSALLVMVLIGAAFFRLPYVEYSPGPTVDVLGNQADQEIIEISGHRAYHDDGQLRMTTVYVSPPEGGIDVYTAMRAWLSSDRAVYPYEAVYPDNQTPEDADRESSVQMVGSQDAAVAAALSELGYSFPTVVEVQAVSPDMPASGRLEVRDVLLRVGTTKIRTAEDVVAAVADHAAGTPLDFRVRRDGKVRVVSVTPEEVDGTPKVGIVPGPGFVFPFDVKIGISEDIGGPSAGLMFSLAIYDTLTPGSLTHGKSVAGTGTIDPKGEVGPIGGIAQKIVGARDAGAELFLVPAYNCSEAVTAPAGDMRLVRADTLDSALKAINDWTDDPDAELPSCETASTDQETN